VATFATLRPSVRTAVDVSGLKHPNIMPEFVQQYMHGGHAPIIGTQDGSTFRTSLYLHGHGSSTSGATSVSADETFIGLALGGTTVVSASAGTTLTGGTATVPTTTASGTFAAGSLAPIGALGDGDGEGQFHVIGGHSTTNLTLLTDMAGAPANGAVLYSAVNMFLNETPTSADVTSIRMRVLTANLQCLLHGCYPTAFTLGNLNTAQVPTLDIDWGVARWGYTTGGTFPSTVTQNAFLPAANAAGSMFVQDVGTSTRALQTFRNLEVKVTLGHVPLMGPGGVGAYQAVVGCRRQPSTIEISWVADADSVTASPALDTMFTSTTGKHILITLNTVAGKRVGIYFPRVFFRGDRPVQFNDGGVNRMRITGTAHTGPTTTNNLTASAMRIAFS
jgi:hypothetical protein